MKPLSIADLIFQWLALTERSTVTSHELEREIPAWVEQTAQLGTIDPSGTIPRSVNPSTVSRRWRVQKEADGGLQVRCLTGV